jgi:uridine kinase
MFDELAKQIKQLLATKTPVVVAISGHGGSGKSTLADKLAHQFGVSENQIVRTDDLHAKNYMQVQGLFEQRDWDTIMKLLSNLKTSNRLKYLKRDDKEIENIVDVPRPSLVIFEGIRLLRPEIMPYVDISVWIDCPIELATKRAKERNRQQGDSEAEIALWDTKWVPESKQYFEQIRPDEIASFIYREYN